MFSGTSQLKRRQIGQDATIDIYFNNCYIETDKSVPNIIL